MKEISPATGRLLALSMLRGIGPATLKKVAGILGFERMSNERLSELVPQLSNPLADTFAWNSALELAEEQIEKADQLGAQILSPLDETYPRLLSATKDDPFLIYVLGSLHTDPLKSVAVIGTRQPTAHGTLIAQRVATYFAESGWSVVSGLAIGCDAQAHQAALDSRGHTVAVLAHGLHTVAPSRHRKLADDILASGGALISEYRIGQEAQPQQFVKRDRTQAGLSQGVVMIQSGLKGGSMHASRAALDYDRWLAVPYPTAQDKDAREEKIQANLAIADGSQLEKTELLRSNASALNRVIVLRSRNDYSKLTANQAITDSAAPPPQGALL